MTGTVETTFIDKPTRTVDEANPAPNLRDSYGAATVLPGRAAK